METTRSTFFDPLFKQTLHALILLVTLGATSGCAFQRAADAEQAQQKMRGQNREEIFSCMGPPRKKSLEGQTEIWVYRSSNEYTERLSTSSSAKNTHAWASDKSDAFSGLLGFEQRTSEKRFCDIHVVFKNNRVATVNYSGPTGGPWTQDEQCAFATRNCR